NAAPLRARGHARVLARAATRRGGLRQLPPRLEPDLFVRIRKRVAGDEAERRLLKARPVATEKSRLEEWREHRALVHELLNAVQHRRALLGMERDRLLAEEAVDGGVAAIGADTAGDDERFDAGGGVAGRRAARPHELLEALLLITLVEGRALERTQLDANADRHQIVDDDLGGAGIHGVRDELAGVEATRITRLGEELLGLGRIVSVERSWPKELEGVRNDARTDPGEPEILGVVDGLAVDGEIGRQPH